MRQLVGQSSDVEEYRGMSMAIDVAVIGVYAS
jgi:hypothetical protein